MSGQKDTPSLPSNTQMQILFSRTTPVTLHAIFLLTNEIPFVHDWILHLSKLQHLQKCKGPGVAARESIHPKQPSKCRGQPVGIGQQGNEWAGMVISSWAYVIQKEFFLQEQYGFNLGITGKTTIG